MRLPTPEDVFASAEEVIRESLAARSRLPRLDDLLLIGGLPDRSSLAAEGAVDGRAQGIESAGRRDSETVEGADEHERVSAVAPSAAPLPGSRC